MDALAALFDMSAHAHGGHYYSSCHYNCGWDMLTGIALIVLVPSLYQLAKASLMDMKSMKDYGVAAGTLSFCALVVIAALFLGPIIVILLIIAGIVALFWAINAWDDWQKKKQGAGTR